MADLRNKSTFLVSFPKRILLFALVTLVCFLIGSIVTALIATKATTPALRVATMVQDVMLFVIPAVVVACLVTRMPGRFLMVDRVPDAGQLLLAIAVLIASVPAMNALVAWNESLSLPESMSGIEQWMRRSEEAAAGMIDTLIGPRDSVGSYIMAVLIVGIMAGFSEELYFRGTMQRILITGPVNPHVAIWVTAFIFSAIHFQFFGFFPRLLLGALFGYLAWWTGSLWVPIAVHVVNNTVVVSEQIYGNSQTVVSTIGTATDGSHRIWIGASIVLTCMLLATLYKLTHNQSQSTKQ